MSIQNKKTIKAYEQGAKKFLNNTRLVDSLYKENANRCKKELRKFIKNTFNELPKESKVLEIGSADGNNSKYIKKLGYNVIPSDVATYFLDTIKKKGFNPIKFNVLEDNFNDTYQAIFCWKVFVHFTPHDILKVLKKSYQALDNNGLLIFNVIDRNCKDVDNEWVDFPGEYHLGVDRYFVYYSKEEIDSIISKTNYVVESYSEQIIDNNINWLVYVLKKKDNIINEELKKYIEKKVFPEYRKNEPGHSIKHIKYVINRSFELVKENSLDVNLDMVYTIASFHDIGHHIDSKRHEIVSAKIMAKDDNLKKFFSKKELKIIKEAIEDHRASKDGEPRSVYGKIVSSADRNNTIEDCLSRTYTYGKKLDPNATDEELYLRAYDVLLKKFGEGGYAKFYFKDKVYEEFLVDIRKLLSNKEKFIKTQKDYVNKHMKGKL